MQKEEEEEEGGGGRGDLNLHGCGYISVLAALPYFTKCSVGKILAHIHLWRERHIQREREREGEGREGQCKVRNLCSGVC